MKLSRSFVSDYIDLPVKDIKDIAEDMTSVGNEYDYAGNLVNVTNLVIGEVISCVKHPDSDKLNVTKVNIGSEVLDIVCGAPNVREGIKVIVAKVGAKLPEIEIKSATIRGVNSNGMLCALSELGIDNKYFKNAYENGIYELGSDAIVGNDPISYLGFDDEYIDFELTSNRGDLLSVLGMAYELGAIYKKDVKPINLEYNEIDKSIEGNFYLNVDTKYCPLFLVKKIEDIEIKESPLFIQKRLIASGMRPINNVVDISNYVMLETGQPLHFYDADKLGNNITVRTAEDGENLMTLDSNNRVLSSEDIVITDGKKAVGLAGVMGGFDTEITSNTKNVVIESAIFDGFKIRKTSKKILRSEASNRFEKGIDPKRTYMAINRSCVLLEKYANAKIVKGIVEYNNVSDNDLIINVNYNKVNSVLGLMISKDEINSILNSLGFDVSVCEDVFSVTVPSRRLDLKIEEDIIEEIGRIYGIDNIKGKLPVLSANVGKYNKIKREIKNKMVSLGLNETLSYTLIPEGEVKKFTNFSFNHIKLADPMSSDRNTLRYSLLYSLKEVYLYNKARNLEDISIFEYGKGFYEVDGYHEENKLACLMSGNYYLGLNKTKVDFYVLKGIVEELLDYLGYSNRYSFVYDENVSSEFHPKQSASIILQGICIGVIGKIHPTVLKDDVYAFEILIDKMLEVKSSKMNFKDISKYPSIKKDAAFVMNKNMAADEVIKVIKKSGGKLLSNVEIFDYYEGDNIGADNKSIAYNLTFSDPSKTLTEDEVMQVFNQIIDNVISKCNVVLRDK